MSRKTHPLFTAPLLAPLWLFLAGASIVAVAAEDVNDAPRAEGTWQGALELGGQRLRLIAHIRRGPDGLTGTLDSIDQQATGLPLDAVSLTEDVLSFQITQIGARYAGNFYGNDTIRGVWSQGLNSLPLILRRNDEVPSARRSQEPVLPLPYVEQQDACDSALRIIGDCVLERAQRL
jgi:hypothetical protein